MENKWLDFEKRTSFAMGVLVTLIYMGIGANFYAGIDRISSVDIRSTQVLIGLSLVPFVQLELYLRRNDVG